ncbi:efflux RND transporter periplasmic adaptor subunit [Melittangium boletus]|uniref:RND efflux system, membrane fusion protein CmeA n=1 Tax=Melittangium boletus DSM 14713 TaxID=1294270 RepID=A0A250IKA6_9BACT|nr:efflux RND transporter periplasmic adaptor subunit [Melittangium boletus]ATB31708.1 RND efflux system, membrane fusion protein CmeA [Melittangium boletus DSM 14713]
MLSLRDRGSRFSTLALLCLLGAASCKQEAQSSGAPEQPQAVEVGIVTVQPQSVPVLNDLPGRITPTRSAEVRPRVSGIIVERVFKQGATVKAGDVLFKIDSSLFEVERASARALLARAEATAQEARQQGERAETLMASNVITREQYDAMVAARQRADAEVASARAALRRAEINLEYATIRAPIGGRIGRALVTEGTLVREGDVTALALIQQLDPIYADFTQPATELNRLRRAAKAGQVESATPGLENVQLLLEDGSLYSRPGRLLFSDVSVDPSSGQVTLRGEFPNPDDELLPGMFVRIRIEQGTVTEALAVPQQAIQRDSAGKPQLFVVGADNKAELRPVVTTRVYHNQALIQEGVRPGDRVIVDGFQKIAAGSRVQPVAWTAPGTGTTPSQPR